MKKKGNLFENEFASKVEFMQFTGLKDKNGKEIFEGDVLKSEFKYNEKLIIVKWIGGDKTDFQGFDICQVFEKYEVIGNKFENPKLL